MKRIKLVIKEVLLIYVLFLVSGQAVAIDKSSNAVQILFADQQMAIVESDAFKKYKKETDAVFEARTKKLKAIQDSINNLKEKFLKEGPALTDMERATRELEIKRKDEDLSIQIGQLNNDRSRSDQEAFTKIDAMLQKAMEQVAKDHGPNATIFRKVGLGYSDPKNDVTRKVIERLNQMK